MGDSELMDGITSESVATPRLETHFLSSGPEDAEAVILLHGNASSSRFFEETMAAMDDKYRALAPDMRGFGDSETKPLDATKGVGDFSEDLRAFIEALGLGKVHLVGWSAGGSVTMRYAMDYPDSVASITLIAPMSPYGFGGTKDISGTPCHPDFAGSGGGTANPDFVKRLSEGDRSDEDANSPRNVMNAFYFKPPFRAEPEREEACLTSVLSTKVVDGNYPGDMTASENWPTVAPGAKGMNNAISPKYCDLSAFAGIHPKPDVLWVRGADDQIVSDASFLDFGTLGRLGFVPEWPGEEVFPPQPMVSQTRAVLEAYKANGGNYREEVLEDCGHSPHVEKPEEFRRMLSGFLGG
ncbi:MAG: alpha/beta hydrolase [Actinomycetota bacterium]|nr:alpha/beta hydrolase [Rubrobacter sp.]MDQ3506975.1 alpha/beta hydrolase [Actinomycetota bacterium]